MSMNITPDQARELLDGATPGPWDVLLLSATKEAVNVLVGEDAVQGDGECLATFDSGFGGDPEWTNPEGNLPLIAAAPELAQTIATMRWEYGVEQATGVTQWFRSRPMAEAHAEVRGAFRLVRRLVGPTEAIDGE